MTKLLEFVWKDVKNNNTLREGEKLYLDLL